MMQSLVSVPLALTRKNSLVSLTIYYFQRQCSVDLVFYILARRLIEYARLARGDFLKGSLLEEAVLLHGDNFIGKSRGFNIESCMRKNTSVVFNYIFIMYEP
jgi:hypothetical protein